MVLLKSVCHESWPLAAAFSISRGTKTTAEVVVVELTDGDFRGRGECVPYPRYGETVESVMAQIEAMQNDLANGMDRIALQSAMPAGAARCALDGAFWDLEAKRAGCRAWQLAGEAEPGTVTTVYTISLDTPEKMGASAKANAARPLMKLKLTGEGDLDRVAAVRQNAPNTELVVDANEGWSPDMVEPFSAELAALGVTMIEQPLPASDDAVLASLAHPIPICADESVHTRDGLSALVDRYDMINIKLDKTGGLTEGLALKREAQAAGLGIMVGCMVGTSLSMAPAVLLGQGAAVVDLDGPLLLAKDRADGLSFNGSVISPPAPSLWG